MDTDEIDSAGLLECVTFFGLCGGVDAYDEE